MKPTITPSDTLVLEKDSKGYINVKLYQNGQAGINILTLTKYPDIAQLDKISRTVLFLKDRYASILQDAGICSQVFKTAEGYTCGMINIDVFFELDNSPNGQYTVKVN